MARSKPIIPEGLVPNFVKMGGIYVPVIVRDRIHEERGRRWAIEGIRYSVGNIITDLTVNHLPPSIAEVKKERKTAARKPPAARVPRKKPTAAIQLAS